MAAEVGGERPGRCVMVRGRRRVGKSRLVERFAEHSGAPFLFYAATGASPRADLARLARDAQASTLPLAGLVAAARPESWDAAFDVLAAALPADRASVLVIDEVPYLMDADGAFEGMLQRAWDRALETKPVLLVLIGSDLSMMEALNSHGRPFHQRGREMLLGPLNPAEVGRMLGLEPAEAFDAALVTGGLPLICAEWSRGEGLWDFLGEALSDPVSALLVSAERSLAAEFPPQAQARTVLAAIGSGERTFTNIARAAGGIGATPLQRALELLTDKRIVAAELPVSLRPSKDRRYRVTDPYLRFWLHLLGRQGASLRGLHQVAGAVPLRPARPGRSPSAPGRPHRRTRSRRGGLAQRHRLSGPRCHLRPRGLAYRLVAVSGGRQARYHLTESWVMPMTVSGAHKALSRRQQARQAGRPQQEAGGTHSSSPRRPDRRSGGMGMFCAGSGGYVSRRSPLGG